MANPLDALERAMEEAVEGTFQRLFRPKLQPVQLAKAAVRQMEAQQTVGPDQPSVPNRYVIALHPRDFEAFARYRQALERELATYLTRYARERGWQPVGRVDVALIADSSLRRGRSRVQASFEDLAASELRDEPASPAPAAAVSRRTLRQPRVSRPLAPPSRTIQLVGENGDRWELARPLVTLGRALENDVVLADSRVSRYHAELRVEAGRYLLRDLGSTNGTTVAGAAGERWELSEGQEISLGGFRLTFRLS